jgi:hypothetical protein
VVADDANIWLVYAMQLRKRLIHTKAGIPVVEPHGGGLAHAIIEPFGELGVFHWSALREASEGRKEK